jgi:tetratricopeptide (TPR) repeat protein
MKRLCVGAALAAALVLGCQMPQVATVTVHDCGGDGKAADAPTLTAFANSKRDTGLLLQASSEYVGAGAEDFRVAAICYKRALQLSPDSYEANLGIGVAFLGLARSAHEEANLTKKTLAQAAKHALGHAYMVRQGPYEPVYYLAELAVFEKDYTRAKTMLELLSQADAKRGPVQALLGYIAEKTGDRTGAQSHYRAAVAEGGPIETMFYASAKVK